MIKLNPTIVMIGRMMIYSTPDEVLKYAKDPDNFESIVKSIDKYPDMALYVSLALPYEKQLFTSVSIDIDTDDDNCKFKLKINPGKGYKNVTVTEKDIDPEKLPIIIHNIEKILKASYDEFLEDFDRAIRYDDSNVKSFSIF